MLYWKYYYLLIINIELWMSVHLMPKQYGTKWGTYLKKKIKEGNKLIKPPNL